MDRVHWSRDSGKASELIIFNDPFVLLMPISGALQFLFYKATRLLELENGPLRQHDLPKKKNYFTLLL